VNVKIQTRSIRSLSRVRRGDRRTLERRDVEGRDGRSGRWIFKKERKGQTGRKRVKGRGGRVRTWLFQDGAEAGIGPQIRGTRREGV